MAAVLMMSAKLATLGLLKVEVFSNKGYNAIKKNVKPLFYKDLTRKEGYSWFRFNNCH